MRHHATHRRPSPRRHARRNPDILSAFVPVIAIAAVGFGGLALITQLGSKVQDLGNRLPGGNNSPVNQNPPASGTGVPVTTPIPTGVPADSLTGSGTCDNAVIAGSVIGKQKFLSPNKQPSCGTFTFPQLLYKQQGYIDPASGNVIGADVTYAVWRCLNNLTFIDDGWFYLSPLCSGY